MQDKHAGNFTVSPKTCRYSHVEFGRHHIRQVMKAQSGLMAVDPVDGLRPISGPKRPKHQVRALTSRKARQPIDSPMFTNPVSHLNMVRMGVLREPYSFSLLRREETLLALSYLVEPLGGLFAPISHSTILQLI